MTNIYLDNATTSYPKPESVYQAVEKFMRFCGCSPGRGSYPKAQESEQLLVGLRLSLARLLGVSDPSRIIFTSNSTEALNLALKGWLQEGDHCVLTDLEHNAVVRPLWTLQRSHNIKVTVVKSDQCGKIDPKEIRKAVTPQTRLIVCLHASNVLGTVQPIKNITALAHEQNIPVLVDGSQTVGAIPFSIDDLGADLFAFTGHKSLLGPTGTGGLVVRPGIELKSLIEGGTGSSSLEPEQPTTWPEKYESGTPNMFGLAGLKAGVEFLLETGVDRIQNHEIKLTRLFMEKLAGLEHIKVHGPGPEDKVGITSISLEVLDTAEVGQILGKKFGIMVRTGIHCAPFIHQKLGTQGKGTVRFSVGWFNSQDEIEKAAEVVCEIANSVYRRVR